MIILDSFDLNKHLTIKELSHVASCNIGKYIPRFSYFAIHEPKGSWNKLQNMGNSENIFHIALGTVQ